MEELTRSLINQLATDNSRAIKIGKTFVFGTDCAELNDYTELIAGLNSFALIEKIKKQMYSPCQTSIPEYYNPPSIVLKQNNELTIECGTNGYKIAFNIFDFIESGSQVVDVTSLQKAFNPSIGSISVSMDGSFIYTCPIQSIERTVFIYVGIKSHYSIYPYLLAIKLTLLPCVDCSADGTIEEITCLLDGQITQE